MMGKDGELLFEWAMHGYFTLKVVFVRLGIPVSGELPPAFDAVFAIYLHLCRHTGDPRGAREFSPALHSRLMNRAFREFLGIIFCYCLSNVLSFFISSYRVGEYCPRGRYS